MKTLLPLILLSTWGFAQTPTVLFHENFDLPSGGDSVSTNFSLFNPSASPTTHLWNDTSITSLKAGQVYHVYGEKYYDIYFETQAFSTMGSNSFIMLEFEHIAKMYLANNGTIKVSVDNGLNWVDILSNDYYGNSSLFNTNNYFNEGAYITPDNLWQVGSNILPQSNWWVKETFDLSKLTYDNATNSGYNNVKIRFNARFSLGAPGSTTANNIFYAGWFVDNIKVLSNPCELIAPIVEFNVGNGICILKPEGNMVPTSSNSYEVGLTAIDPQGTMDRVELIYQVNNGLEDTLLMPNLSANTYRQFIPNVFSGDSVKWYVNAYDTCNVKREPFRKGSYFQFFIDSVNYSKCGFQYCNKIPSIINTFPWFEDFESNEWVAGNNGVDVSTNAYRGTFPILDNWLIAPPVNQIKFGWSIADSTSHNPSTGPQNNHTIGGKKYIYTEGSLTSYAAGTNLSISNFTTPCIDLTQENTDYIFQYYYHFFGNDIHRFQIDIDTGTAVGSWWQQYKIIDGPTHNSSFSSWKKDIISLAPFRGKIIKLRFVAIKKGNGEDADFALDDFSIYAPVPNDAGLEENDILSASSCELTSATEVEVILRNFGADTIFSLPIAYQINNNTIVRETATVNLSTGDTTLYTFNTKADFSVPGNYVFKVWTELNSDTDFTNDTLINKNIQKLPVNSGFPLSLNFESSVAAPDLNGISNGSLINPAFILNGIDNSAFNGGRWMIYDQPVKDTSTGPVGGSFRKGNYLLFNNNYPGTAPAEFKTTCLDFTSLSSPRLSFKYHSYFTNHIKVYIREFPSDDWIEIYSISTNSVAEKQHEYSTAFIDLGAYAGSMVEIKWQSQYHYNKYFAMDDILIFDKSSIDLSLINEETRFYNTFVFSLPSSMNFIIANAGNNLPPIQSFNVKGQFIENCVSNPKIYNFHSGIMGAAPVTYGTKTYIRNLNYDSIPLFGNYTLKMWVDIAGDTNPYNDTIVKNSILLGTSPAPYFNDFEKCTDKLIPQGMYRQWDRAQPVKSGSFNSAHSGSYVSMFSPHDDVAPSLDLMLLPHFVGLDSLFGAELRFWQNFELLNGIAQLRYMNGASWDELPIANNAINWTQNFNPANGFIGSSNGWIRSSYPLSALGLSPGEVLQLAFYTENISAGRGWMIDDLEIVIPPQYSAGPTKIVFNTMPIAGNNDLTVQIKNTGNAPFQQVGINTIVNGNQIFNNYVSQNLYAGDKVLMTLSTPFTLNGGAINNFTVITSNPDNRMDEIPEDDTLKLSLFIPEDVDSLPYCTDFELTEDFMAYNFTLKGIDTSWSYGQSNKTLMGGAHSGSNAWFTNKADYGVLSDQFLVSPSFQIKKDSCYYLSFFHQFITESNFDGATVEFTLDEGISWQVLGEYGDSNWFNTPAIQSNGYKAGWSGNSSGWQKAEKLMRFFDDGKVQFRFHFASNSSINMEGWMLDDFCFENSNQGCEMVTIEEAVTDISELKLYPNPARDKMWVVSPVYIKGGTAFITDMKGKRILTIEQELIPNEPVELEINDLSPGMYFLNYTSENTSGNVKFMVQ